MADKGKPTQSAFQTDSIINDILTTIDREREREIISRRYGLYDRKETLEQIGELQGITRERVRQLEKAVISKLKALAEQGSVPHVSTLQDMFIDTVKTMGGAARISDLTEKLVAENTKIEQSRIAFLVQLCSKLAFISEDDHFYQSVGVRSIHDEKKMKASLRF